MLSQAPIQSFVPVSDFAGAERFYARTLGLSVVSNNGFALIVKNAAGQELRLVLTPDAKPQPFTILGWQVSDLAAAATELKKHRVEPTLYPHLAQDGQGIWTAPSGDQVLWFHDPDGNVLSLSQSAGPRAQ